MASQTPGDALSNDVLQPESINTATATESLAQLHLSNAYCETSTQEAMEVDPQTSPNPSSGPMATFIVQNGVTFHVPWCLFKEKSGHVPPSHPDNGLTIELNQTARHFQEFLNFLHDPNWAPAVETSDELTFTVELYAMGICLNAPRFRDIVFRTFVSGLKINDETGRGNDSVKLLDIAWNKIGCREDKYDQMKELIFMFVLAELGELHENPDFWAMLKDHNGLAVALLLRASSNAMLDWDLNLYLSGAFTES